MPTRRLVEASIADLRRALEDGTVTSVEVVAAFLRRIAHYDRHGIALNAVPILNPKMFEEAEASDRRRREGRTLGRLDGIPTPPRTATRPRG
ncbi:MULTISPECIES: hypothetical protein [unclassified Mesorhizobium]|uniref:hypothetical protein n=1 Tax=unclassified Mesorhizobium TaxID=325217 RepID=UPI001FF04B99|nr:MULTISPECIES: hypothetical protein [unclassified Mesorhizobium]